jgi:uncharacterized repeat protein (TIGR01451 family)
VPVSSLSGVTAVAGGKHHSVALHSSGTVFAWGYNGYGQLGDGSNTNRNIPVASWLWGTTTAIGAGGNHTLAVRADGTAFAWGSNDNGQLGNGAGGPGQSSNLPVQTVNLTGAFAISGGAAHSLAINSPLVSITPASLSFGGIPYGSTSAPKNVTISNNGPDPLTVNSLSVTGAHPNDFSVASPPLPLTIAAGSSAVIAVTFSPGSIGSRTATLRINNNGFGNPHTVSLSGGGTIPQADLSVAQAVVVAGQQITYSIVVRNNGPSAAAGVQLRDLMPANTQLVDMTTTHGTCDGPSRAGAMGCSLGNLPAGEHARLILIVQVTTPKPLEYVNTASVSSQTLDLTSFNNSSSVTTTCCN